MAVAHPIMMPRAWLALVFATSAAAAVPHTTASAATPPDDVIPIELAGDRVIVPVRIGEMPPQPFLLDTGSSGSLISPSIAASLQLAVTHERPVGGAGEKRPTIPSMGRVTFRVGARTFDAPHVAAFDLAGLEASIGHHLAGVLGAELFRLFTVELNPAARTLRISSQDGFVYSGRGERLPIAIRVTGLPYVKASVVLANQRVAEGEFLVDTGHSRALTINKPFVDLHDMLANLTVTPTYNGGMGGEFQAVVGRLPRFVLGASTFVSPPVDFSRSAAGSTAGRQTAGRIGMPILGRFILTFDYLHGQMWAEPLPGFRTPIDDDVSGAVLFGQGPDLSTVSVLRVIDGSPAAKAGLRAGDTIVWIDGELVEQLDRARELFRQPDQVFHVIVMRHGKQTDLTLKTRKR